MLHSEYISYNLSKLDFELKVHQQFDDIFDSSLNGGLGV